ncbi:HAD domain-containing protein [Streptomyces sp. cmx-4-9]|uniref:HAD domain-containing protein n=1 Tax=Streptomyces sp. cmx-4-9 TaxID=2790941 RepID=UPI0039812D02
MTGSVPPRPLLFLDVDGPLIPFGGEAGHHPTYAAGPDSVAGPGAAGAHPLLARIDPAHGARLVALPCEVVWATTWGDDANACVAPRLGLPELEVLSWPEATAADEALDLRNGLHAKTRLLIERAAGRPFAWVDDEITDRDRVWVAAHHPGPALLHRVDPRRGLTAADFTALDSWLRQPS